MKPQKAPSQLDDIRVPRFDGRSGFYTSAQRSKIMSRIKGKDTKAEMLLRKALWAKGLRYRVHRSKLPGKPDIVVEKYRLAIFVDGAFWHGFDWGKKKARIKANPGFWVPKIERNMQRDAQNNLKLEEAGYTVMRFWDHQVCRSLDKCVNQVFLYIESASLAPIPENCV